MQRRDFLKISAAGAAVVCSPAFLKTELRADDGRLYKSYNRVRLVDDTATPLKFSELETEKGYIFHYPYRSTPSMMIKLQSAANRDVKLRSADGQEYIWKGGVGKGGTLVAFTAICSHQLTHPTPEANFVTYSGQEKTMSCDKKGVIVCASHLSAFDPKDGGKHIAGPANEGLAAMVLEVDENDHIWAVGVLGPDKFHEYFKTFKHELKEWYGGRKGRRLIEEESETHTIENFSTDVVLV